MKQNRFSQMAFLALILCSSCVTKKKMGLVNKELAQAKTDLAVANRDLGKCGVSLNEHMAKLAAIEKEKASTQRLYEDQIAQLRLQVADCQTLRDRQLNQVGDLTTLSQSANENMRSTLAQLQQKDQYIGYLQAAKTKADSINLALTINLTGMLRDGIADEDIEVNVDKTVVFVNLSDKMLFQSGSSNLTPRAQEVLGKIAQIVASRPDLQVMVEGYTDNQPIKTACVADNWDLSADRATAVVRVLQTKYKLDPNRLIAAGRGEYNPLATNTTAQGRATNRRTRIIIMPKLDQFYDLLDPSKAPK
jgi:chemotaxis protein MotB